MFSGYLLKQSIQAFYTPNKITFWAMTLYNISPVLLEKKDR